MLETFHLLNENFRLKENENYMLYVFSPVRTYISPANRSFSLTHFLISKLILSNIINMNKETTDNHSFVDPTYPYYEDYLRHESKRNLVQTLFFLCMVSLTR